MKAYIERPISEKPEKEGWYHTVGTELVAYWHGDNNKVYAKWLGWDSEITHWLQPVELPQGNAEVLVKALERIKEDSFNHNHAKEIATAALSSFTAKPQEKEVKP